MKSKIVYPFIIITVFLVSACSSNYGIKKKDDKYFLRLPNNSGDIKFPSSNFIYQDFPYTMMIPDGLYMFYNEKDGIHLAVELGWDFDSKPLMQYRDSLYRVIKKQNKNIESVVFTDKENYSAFEYFLPVNNDNLKNEYSYISFYKLGGYWIKFMISKYNYQNNSYPLFSNIYENIRVERDNESILSLQDSIKEDVIFRIKETRVLFEKKETDKIIFMLEKVIQLQNEFKVLDDNDFYDVLAQLAICYGVKGKTDKCIELANYGLSIDSKYPMFYYTLACAYSDKENFDLVLSNLEQAVKYKYRLSYNTPFPNPAVDPSFKKYLNNEEFIRFLKKNKFL